MKTSSRRLAVLIAVIVPVLVLYPTVTTAATVTVTVGNNCFCFQPASVTIHPGDTVQGTWSSTGHSSTSGTPGHPTGLWDSTVLNEGDTFSHTFNTVGSFPYYCTPHGALFGMTGTVTVASASPTPAPTPTPTPAPVTGPPVVTTSPATFVASFSARLNASLNPHGLATTFHFQYGTTTSYGLTTAPQTQSGNTVRTVSANITSLTAHTTYHFRIVASNSAGTRMGADRTFTTLTATGAPVAITNPATNVTASSALLHGSVDPHGLSTTVHFQYGTTISYGHNTANQ